MKARGGVSRALWADLLLFPLSIPSTGKSAAVNHTQPGRDLALHTTVDSGSYHPPIELAVPQAEVFDLRQVVEHVARHISGVGGYVGLYGGEGDPAGLYEGGEGGMPCRPLWRSR